MLPVGTRVVVVTKGHEWESPAEIATKAPRDTTVVMSTDAWGNYEVPGSPYFVLIDGDRNRRVGEGVGASLAEIAEMIRQAEGDQSLIEDRGSRSHAAPLGLNGEEREAHNDALLRAAGIVPGDPSLYPRGLGARFSASATPEGH